MTQVGLDELRDVVLRVLRPRFSETDATRIADVVLFGEMAGRPSHGVLRLLPGSYGVMDEEDGPTPIVTRMGPSAARVEGKQGMIVASIATDMAEELATSSGFAVVTTRGSRSTSGSLTYFAERLAGAGLFSFISAGTPDFVAIPGGDVRVLGTNPMVFGIPTTDAPFVLDMATASVSGGDVLTAAANQMDLGPGIAVDAAGEPTTDPLDVLERGGAVLPFGGHKGLGLALTVEILNRALTGATGDPGDWGHVFVVFSLGLLGDEDEVRSRAQSEVDRLRAGGARIPGHQTLAKRDQARERGWVDIDEEVFRRLQESLG